MEEREFDFEYKIVFLGGSGVGAKTSLIYQLVDKQFIEDSLSTTSASYSSIFIQNNFGISKLNLWDTPRQQEFLSFIKYFIKDSHCIILGYDITNKYSFNEIKEFCITLLQLMKMMFH